MPGQVFPGIKFLFLSNQESFIIISIHLVLKKFCNTFPKEIDEKIWCWGGNLTRKSSENALEDKPFFVSCFLSIEFCLIYDSLCVTLSSRFVCLTGELHVSAGQGSCSTVNSWCIVRNNIPLSFIDNRVTTNRQWEQIPEESSVSPSEPLTERVKRFLLLIVHLVYCLREVER